MGSLRALPDEAATPPRTPLKSFARRPRPKSGFPKLKWECVRSAFNMHVRVHFARPSSTEDWNMQTPIPICFLKVFKLCHFHSKYWPPSFQSDFLNHTVLNPYEPYKTSNVALYRPHYGPHPVQYDFWNFCMTKFKEKKASEENVKSIAEDAAEEFVATNRWCPGRTPWVTT